jgi:opacity protein-like surface antigen
MKKVLLIVALAMFSFANAQKGTILVQGSIGFSSEKNDNLGSENTFNTIDFSPKVGYQFTDNWTLGLDASIASAKEESTTFVGPFPFVVIVNTEEKVTGFAVGPFARYTKPLNETFSVYADMGLGFQSAKTTRVTNDGLGEPDSIERSTFKGDGFYIGVTPAIFINVKNHFGLNVSIGGIRYETLNFDAPGGDNNRFDFNFGQTVNIGISKNF